MVRIQGRALRMGADRMMPLAGSLGLSNRHSQGGLARLELRAATVDPFLFRSAFREVCASDSGVCGPPTPNLHAPGSDHHLLVVPSDLEHGVAVLKLDGSMPEQEGISRRRLILKPTQLWGLWTRWRTHHSLA